MLQGSETYPRVVHLGDGVCGMQGCLADAYKRTFSGFHK